MSKVGNRSHAGAMAYHAGLAAEGRIAQDYARRGFPLANQRWRGRGGEIDLIVRDGEGFIFVEVKFRHKKQFGGAISAIPIAKQEKIKIQ